MDMTLATWMKLATTAVVIAALIWGVLFNEMSEIANAIAGMMNGGTTP